LRRDSAHGGKSESLELKSGIAILRCISDGDWIGLPKV